MKAAVLFLGGLQNHESLGMDIQQGGTALEKAAKK